MAYVGPGGQFVAETTYTYVGNGMGEFNQIPAPVQNNWLQCCGASLCVLIVGSLLVAVFSAILPTTTTTVSRPSGTSPTLGLPGSCTVFGALHAKTFDGSVINVNREGEFWFVKGSTMHIQARFLPTPFSNGLPTMTGLAIGGAFTGGHVVTIGSLDEGSVTCDGQPILQAFPSKGPCGDFVHISYDSRDPLVDELGERETTADLHVLHMYIGDSTRIEVTRWNHHLNAQVTFPQQGQLEGVCGNFNGDRLDDSQAAIESRLGPVPASESLFHRQVPAKSVLQRTVADCDASRREHATRLCLASSPQLAGELLSACVYDVCFVGDKYAQEDAAVERQT